MIAYWVFVIYASFLPDLLVWRVSSEASTYSLVMQKKDWLVRIGLLISVVMILSFYLAPLLLALTSLTNELQPPNRTLALIGLIVAFTGRGISIRTAIQLHHNKEARLMQTGLFRWSRNPITLGLHLTILGLVLIFMLWYLWIGWILYLLYFHFKIRIEEKELRNRYGEDYQNYFKKTPRYIGYV